jgi:hypothetical protein
MKVLDEKKKKKRENNEENIKTPEQSPQDKNAKDPNVKIVKDCELQASRRGREKGGGGEGRSDEIFLCWNEEGKIACHPTSKNPITRLRSYLVNDNSPSLYFLLVLCSRMGCKFISAPMVTASEQQSFP